MTPTDQQRVERSLDWENLKERVDRFVLWTRESAVLSAAAKVALSNIPVVGPTLAEMYDEAGGSGEDTARVLEILARIEAAGATGFEQSVAALQAARAASKDARTALATVQVDLSDLSEALRDIRIGIEPIYRSLERLEAEVRNLSWGATEFDVDLAADRAALLVFLHVSLTRSEEIFGEQLRIANGILDRATVRPETDLKGIDDRLWILSKAGGLSAADRVAFRELRAITDRMRDVNLRVRWLVRRYGSSLSPDIPAKDLDIHLSTWLTKYEYLRGQSDDHMALVFVGVAPTNRPFPRGADAAVARALRAAMEEARLGYLVE
jgi:hypothetical protein